MDKATQEEGEDFFGYTAYGVCTRKECQNNIVCMSKDKFDGFVKRFNL